MRKCNIQEKNMFEENIKISRTLKILNNGNNYQKLRKF